MIFSRRGFLEKGMMVALTAALPLKLAGSVAGQQERNGLVNLPTGFQIPHESHANAVIYFKKSTFSPYLKTRFGIRLKNSKVVQMSLVRVSDIGPAAGRAADALVGKESFSIIFRAPSYSKRIPQDTYTITHGALGTFKLFLVPMDKDTQGLYYQGIINHRHP
jgi:hypothetical protein